MKSGERIFGGVWTVYIWSSELTSALERVPEETWDLSALDGRVNTNVRL